MKRLVINGHSSGGFHFFVRLHHVSGAARTKSEKSWDEIIYEQRSAVCCWCVRLYKDKLARERTRRLSDATRREAKDVKAEQNQRENLIKIYSLAQVAVLSVQRGSEAERREEVATAFTDDTIFMKVALKINGVDSGEWT